MNLLLRTVAALALLRSVAVSIQLDKPLNSLAQDVERVESLREIKDVQRTFAQLAQFGRWSDMAELFSDNGTLVWGNETATGAHAIERWLRVDAGNMDGIKPGSLDTMLIETPVVTLSVDGLSAKGRWNGLRFQGDGKGATRIQGGVYENEYVLIDGDWKISLLRYYAQYAGPYVNGWRNVGGDLPMLPYHFTPEGSGVAIPPPVGDAPVTTATIEELSHRINQLNDEDEVRKVQHAYGYYVDRRMWPDVVDLFVPDDSEVNVDGVGTYTGSAGVLQVMHRMGPEGLTQGFLNEHFNLATIVKVDPNGQEAISRGVELAMIGKANNDTASWEFNVFRNHFVKDNGLWKLKKLSITPLIVANYSDGWGNGGILPPNSIIPDFIDISSRSSNFEGAEATNSSEDLADLQQKLGRSSAVDGVENVSSAYGYYADDINCPALGAVHAQKGHKESPFAGWYQTPARITEACFVVYGRNRSTMRPNLSYHWRLQPVILISQDGQSANLHSRLFQPSTSKTSAGDFEGGMYNDQFVLKNGKWKLWSLNIDEFYWTSKDWAGGWAAVVLNKTAPYSSTALLTTYIPDLKLTDAGEREIGFAGGVGQYVGWPAIQRMFFNFRNPVSGRVPEYYWPGCAPCQVMTNWSLTANGYQEPPTGPAIVNVTSV